MSKQKFFILTIALLILVSAQGILWKLYFPVALRLGGTDFDSYYTAAVMVRTGHTHDLYDQSLQRQTQLKIVPRQQNFVLPFIHPPYEALLFIPFSGSTYTRAYLSFLAVNVCALIAAIALMVRGLAAKVWLGVFLGLGFMPFSIALINGQDSIVLLLLLAFSWSLLRKHQDMAAGLVAGLGLFRFQIVIPVLILFMIWKRWRFAAGFLTSAGAVCAISVAMIGPREMLQYAQQLLSLALGTSNNPDFVQYPERMISLRGWITSAGSGLNPNWLRALIVISSVLLLWWRAKQFPPDGARALEWSIPVALLVGYHVYLQDESILLIALLPMIAVLRRNSWIAWLAFAAPASILAISPMMQAPILLLFSLSQEPEPASVAYDEPTAAISNNA